MTDLPALGIAGDLGWSGSLKKEHKVEGEALWALRAATMYQPAEKHLRFLAASVPHQP